MGARVDRPGSGPVRPAGFIVGQETEYEVTYGYDQYGRLNRISDGPGLPAYGAVYNRLANSELVAYLRYNSEEQTTLASAQRAYEANRDLVDYVENRTSPAPADPVSRYDYANDPERGRRTSVIETGTAFTAASYNLYGYNTRSELTDAERYLGDEIEDPPQNPVAGEDFRYMYDTIGNRRYFIDAAGSHTCNRNSVNQYTFVGNPGTNFTYDADGNLDTDGKYKYVWDSENRLIEAANRIELGANAQAYDAGDRKLTFKYDYLGRRVRKVAWTYNGSGWDEDSDLLFVYDGWNVVMVLDANDGNAILRKYTSGLDLSGLAGTASQNRDREGAAGIHGAGGIGGLLAVEEPQAVGDPERYWYLYDANGNVGQVIDTGDYSIAAKYRYDPFGKTVYAQGPYAEVNPFRFSTKWLDDELTHDTTSIQSAFGSAGIYHYPRRPYSPAIGRWITRDPIGEVGGINLVAFVRNRPCDRQDALGLTWKKVTPCHGLGTSASTSLYWGVGATISASIQATVCDCCDDQGRRIKYDYWDVSAGLGGSVGIGFGAKVKLPLVGQIGWDIRGPELAFSNSLSLTKECGQSVKEVCYTILDASGNLGGEFSIGIGVIGGSISYWASYGVKATACLGLRHVSFSACAYYGGGGEYVIITPIIDYHGSFALSDGGEKCVDTTVSLPVPW